MFSGSIDSRRVMRAGLALLVAAAGLGGCVGQQPYDQLADANRSLTERNNDLLRQNQELSAENGLLQKDRTAKESAIADLTRLNSDMRAQLESMGVKFRDLASRMGGLTLGPLDEQTDKALAALAAQYPDLIKYDQARGMLRFASDLTFNSGDDGVQEGARASLGALAKILTSGAASQYEVFIVGHTDSQKISARTAPRHPTNMHLSAHRAISVRKELAGLGVPAEKMFVAGWGEYRPAVPNTASGNTPANRRVEIYLTRPTSSSEGGAEPAPAPKAAAADREAPPPRQPDMTK